MGDFCDSVDLKVTIQQNGIVRDEDGHILGRLDDDFSFEELKGNQ